MKLKWTPLVYAQCAGILVMIVYGYICAKGYAKDPPDYRLLDHVDLVFHEAGHMIFSFLGDFIHILGGTLGQLFFPVAFVIFFFVKRQPYSASLTLFWVAQSLFNVAVYARDAKDRELPILGNNPDCHDWYQMLSELNLIENARGVGGFIFGAGVVALVVGVVLAIFFTLRDAQNKEPEKGRFVMMVGGATPERTPRSGGPGGPPPPPPVR